MPTQGTPLAVVAAFLSFRKTERRDSRKSPSLHSRLLECALRTGFGPGLGHVAAAGAPGARTD
jgi:hypothetical protein